MGNVQKIIQGAAALASLMTMCLVGIYQRLQQVRIKQHSYAATARAVLPF